MTDITKHYIDGAFVEGSGATRDLHDPATGRVNGSMVLGTEAELNTAVAAARKAFARFSQTSREDRIALLGKVIEAYQARFQDMADAIREEMGAPKGWAEKAQAPSGLGHLVTAMEALKIFKFEEEHGTHLVAKEPIGVVGMITPWNWPINQITCKVAAALATGCTMVLKPSEITPSCAQVFAEIMDAAGVPAGVFNVVYGEGPTIGAAMSAHPDIDLMSLTGSTRAGASVQQNAAATIKRVALELGGKSANILLDDVDFASVVARDAAGMMMNTGQSCNALTRMLVPHNRMDEAAAIAAAAVDSLKVGDPMADGVRVGPIAHKAQYEKVRSLIETGVAEGAKLVTGGLDPVEGAPEGGYYVRPTVFSHVTPDMTIAREEIFGPVLSIIGYADEEEAIHIANDTIYGLSGAVSSADPKRAQAVARRLRTGMVIMNGANFDFTLPFGGYKQSGLGREWGSHGFDDYLEVKALAGFAA